MLTDLHCAVHFAGEGGQEWDSPVSQAALSEYHAAVQHLTSVVSLAARPFPAAQPLLLGQDATTLSKPHQWLTEQLRGADARFLAANRDLQAASCNSTTRVALAQNPAIPDKILVEYDAAIDNLRGLVTQLR